MKIDTVMLTDVIMGVLDSQTGLTFALTEMQTKELCDALEFALRAELTPKPDPFSDELNDLQLVNTVYSRVQKNPELFSQIVMACSGGVATRIAQERERAADFETVASAMMTLATAPRITPTLRAWAEQLAQSKTDKWRDKACCVWPTDVVQGFPK